MKQCKKVLALVLALVMLLSAVGVGLTASATNVKNLYTGAALSGKMNKADSYELENEQYASIILDFADKALAEANIAPIVYPLTGGLRISINLKSINQLNTSIMGLDTLIDKVPGSLLGDVQKLYLKDFTTNTARDGRTCASDVRFINALVSFINNESNYSRIKKLVQKGVGSGDGQFDAGAINGMINDMAGDIVGDIVGFLKKTLFQDSNANFDTEVASLITELLNGLDLEMIKGYTFETSDTLYSTVDKLARVITRWAVSNVQADTWQIKENILAAMPSFEKDYPFVKLDNITSINWDWQDDGMGTKYVAGNASTYLVYHVNNCIGSIVETIIPEFKNFKGTYAEAGWKKDNSTSSLSTLNTNIAKAAQFADIKLNNGGSFTEQEIASMTNPTKSYAMVLANTIIKMFFPGIKVEKQDILQGNIAVLAVQALNEFMAYYIPDNVLTDLYTYNETGTVLNRSKYTESYCQSQYKKMCAQLLAKFVSGYFPEQSGKLEFSNKNDLDAVLKDIVKYFMNIVCKAGSLSEGALGTISNSDTVYTAVDRIILSLNSSGVYQEGASPSGARNVTGIIPEGFLPDSIKASGHTHCTSKDAIDHLFNCVNDLNFGDLFKILIPNASNSEMNTSLFPTLVSREFIRIINVIFPGTWTSKTDSLNALITNPNLGTMLANIMSKLNINYHVYPGLKLVSTLMGLSTAQTRGEAEIDLSYKFSDSLYTKISPEIASGSTASQPNIPANYNITVTNTSKGINGGYHSSTGSEVQYEPYKLQVVSIQCVNDSNVTVSGVGDTTIVKSDESMNFPISGKATNNKVLEFLVTYKMSNELGSYKGSIEQQSRLYAFFGNRAFTSARSNSVTVKIPSTIYGTPSMLNSAVGYYNTNDASASYSGSAEDSVFPTALKNAGFDFKAANTGTPESTLDAQFNPFSVSVPSGVEIGNYAGTYQLTYNLKTMDTSAEGSSYGSNTPINVNWVLFDDGGLEKLVNSIVGEALQSGDFSNTDLWNTFEAELIHAQTMLKNPSSAGTTAAALTTAFANEKEVLENTYKALKESSTADYTGLLKERLVEYADGDPENNIRPKYTRWDYATVGYARYDSSLSTVRDYYQKKESSSIKVTEALRYNEEMAKPAILFADSTTEVSKGKAQTNLQTIYNEYNPRRSSYTADKYTPGSIEPLMEALDQAKQVLDGTGLDGQSAPKISDYADARSDILAALNKLIDQPLDIAALNALVTQVKEQYNDNMYYTDAAWNVFEKALATADQYINDPYSLLDEDYTAADVARVNAQITNEVIPQVNAAVQTLQDNPYISSLSGTATGAVAYDFGKQIVCGPKVIDASEYIIVPYGTTVANVSQFFEFSKNTSKYTKDDEGNWNTYCSVDGSPSFTIYNAAGRAQSSGLTKVRSDWTVTVTAPGIESHYTIVVTANVGNKSISASLFAQAPAQLATILPNVIANVGVDALKPAEILACDLNGDGMVDNTDLSLLKMWQTGRFTPYNINI
ncbi:MAG: hypothetical protein IJI67_04115 [Clostridia bacterium]|nr:hypothetical protein [Clostridia bacterium]